MSFFVKGLLPIEPNPPFKHRISLKRPIKQKGVVPIHMMVQGQSMSEILRTCPYARAAVHGGTYAPCLRGFVSFYPWARGTLVKAEVVNLPAEDTGPFLASISMSRAAVRRTSPVQAAILTRRTSRIHSMREICLFFYPTTVMLI